MSRIRSIYRFCGEIPPSAIERAVERIRESEVQ